MTTTHAGYIVTLADNIREDDAQAVINALAMVKGVIAVEPVENSPELLIAKQRIDRQWRAKMFDLSRDGV